MAGGAGLEAEGAEAAAGERVNERGAGDAEADDDGVVIVDHRAVPRMVSRPSAACMERATVSPSRRASAVIGGPAMRGAVAR